ncbi:hypothetical protein D9V37_09145 [Nocardioides mangrovicus]|uniref:Uncharacterized protein n=1 Tax=Nocardioides mangrovicus TaxID=2478913 RepID=A0A3L8P5H6_9ACTN|nr:HAD domain-containing protein [Nocardioides mangrovicus]RLV50023.1 hypothetical protein D9V37_09145 [Nocardioides mangrovicus]
MAVHLYVDVDGVLNALAPTSDSGWESYESVVVRGYRIQWSPELVVRLNALAAREDTAMHWLTTWGADAPGALCPALGIDGRDWPVLGPVEHHIGGRSWGGLADGPWWKLEAIAQHLPDGVPAVWLDDDLRHDPDALAWVEQRGDVLGIAPALETGLTRAEVDQVERFVAGAG